MATPSINLIIEQGEDFSATFAVLDPDETAAALNSYTVNATLKKHPGSSTSYTFTTTLTSSQGKITISLPNSVTSTLKPGRYYYDIFITNTPALGSLRTKVVEGNAIVNGSATEL
jgi:hypothetical protein